MRANNVVGIVFANAFDEVLQGMTAGRAIGSVPFGGGYRLIDFTLSNMVNGGISKIGVITNNKYQSLLDHLNSGKPWDLARKKNGLFLLPPFNAEELARHNHSRVGALRNILHFLSMCDEEFIVMSDCNAVLNLDMKALLKFHEDNNADVTFVYKNGKIPSLQNRLVIDTMQNDRILQAFVTPVKAENGDFSLNITVMRKALLESMIKESVMCGYNSIEKDIILPHLKDLNVFGYRFDGFCPVIDSVQSYYDANFALLDSGCYRQLFVCGRPIFTKVYDDMPAVYGLGSEVKNSLIADGCIIEGTVENSIIFRNCKIEKGVTVRNSVIMPGAFIGRGSTVNCCIFDKEVTVKPDRNLSGAPDYPVYFAKHITV